MSLQSPYSLTLTPSGGGSPTTLLEEDGWIVSAPVLSATQELSESDGILLPHGFFRPMGGIQVDIEIAIEVDHANTLAALNAFLDSADSLLSIGGTLVFTPNDGGAAVTFENAVVRDITPDLPSGIAATTHRTFVIQTSLPT